MADGARDREKRDQDRQGRAAELVLWIGAGRRARAVGAVLATLSTLPEGEQDSPRAPLASSAIGDLEGLLASRAEEGLLILEPSRVPLEDIGFVRRFLERHPRRRLLVLDGDPQDARVRSLLALPRAQGIRWPPDLDELGALLGPPGTRAEPERSREPAPARRPAQRSATAPASAGVDVGSLLEELLAGAALEGAGASRYQFRASETFLVQRERAPLAQGLAGLVEPRPEADSRLFGLDASWKWRPLARKTRNSATVQAEAFLSHRDVDVLEAAALREETVKAWGGYLYGEYQFARRWRAGVRWDRTQFPDDEEALQRALSAVLRIVPSEFQEFRIQFKGTRRNEQAAVRFDDQDEDHEIFFEWIPAIGAHAAHAY